MFGVLVVVGEEVMNSRKAGFTASGVSNDKMVVRRVCLCHWMNTLSLYQR